MRFFRVHGCVIYGSFAFSVKVRLGSTPDLDTFGWSERDGVHGPYMGLSVPKGLAVVTGSAPQAPAVFCHNFRESHPAFPLHASRGSAPWAAGGKYVHASVLHDERSAVAICSQREVSAVETPAPAWWPDEAAMDEYELSRSVLSS